MSKVNFLVIPAVDIKEGKAVRLTQGRMDQETVYSEDPIQMALHWQDMGAERLHVVDLDAAVKGTHENRGLIKDLIKAVQIPVQVGGGIRDLKAAEEYISSGASYIIVGTAAIESPTLFQGLKESFPQKVILSVDARDGLISVRGWTKDLSKSVVELVKEYEDDSLSALIYTDIMRDGMKTGPDFKRAVELLRNTKIPVILAGGIRDIQHIKEALELRDLGLLGVITGRAIYDGTLDLKEAIALTKRSSPC